MRKVVSLRTAHVRANGRLLAHRRPESLPRLWKAVPKIVFSSTLQSVEWNARLVTGDAIAEVARLKAQPGNYLGLGGLSLASSLASAGLIDEYRLYYVPLHLGSSKAAFRELTARVRLQPVETRTFTSGTVLLRCVPASSPP